MNFTLEEISQILGTNKPGRNAVVAGYSIDSRTIRPGELFFAIRGPRFDGHDFVKAALERGAIAAVVERGEGLRVAGTTDALARVATEHRRRWGGRLVAITGSAGKTTTKDMVASILSTRFHVLKSEGNFNNEYGLPLSLLKLDDTHDVGVFEMGMSHAGEITKLARIAQPDTGVVTCVAPVHLEFFSGIEGIARAKQELIIGLPANGHAILNADDPFVSRFGMGFEGYKVSFGMERAADFRAVRLSEDGLRGTRFCLEWEGESVEVTVPLPGRHNVLNAVAALATAHTFGIYPRQAREAMAAFQAPKMRGQLVEVDGVTVVNDCYNSNPRALSFMLEALGRTPAKGRRIAVLGEMLELGPTSAQLHHETGKKAAAAVDHLVAVRGDARHFLEGAAEAGMDRSRLIFFDTAAEAGDYVASMVHSGDVVLLKASRGVKLEAALERIVQEKSAESA